MNLIDDLRTAAKTISEAGYPGYPIKQVTMSGQVCDVTYGIDEAGCRFGFIEFSNWEPYGVYSEIEGETYGRSQGFRVYFD
jgi:hypothetical protein